VLTAAIVTVHVLVATALIVLVLLHSGRGGGLTDMFGGLGAAAAGSSVMERNLDRITVVFAIIFGFTTILLALRLQ
jgi:preprotein translocase subunit SecG